MSNLFANAALSAAFVPVFTDLLQQGRRKEALRLASTLFWIMLIVLGAITAFFILAAGVIMPLFTGPKFTPDARRADGRALAQVLFPVVLLLGLNGLLVGILQSYDHFTIPAISPAVWNVVIIVLLVVLRPHFHGEEAPALRVRDRDPGRHVRAAADGRSARSGGSTSACRFTSTGTTRASSQVFMLMLPVTIGLGIVNLDQLINSVFGTLVSERSAAGDRQRVPRLHAAAGPVQRGGRDRPVPDAQPHGRQRATSAAMRRAVGIGMRQINLLLIPAAAFMIVLAHADRAAAVRTRATSTPNSTDLVSIALFWFAFSLPVRRPEPAADAHLLRGAAAVDPDAAWRR